LLLVLHIIGYGKKTRKNAKQIPIVSLILHKKAIVRSIGRVEFSYPVKVACEFCVGTWKWMLANSVYYDLHNREEYEKKTERMKRFTLCG